MVQFNLLPDIKIQYIKARRQKRLVTFTSTIVVVSALSVLVLLISFVFGIQKKSMNDLNKDIDDKGSQLRATPELDKILTVQNQLKALPGLHDQKPIVNRLFGYVSQVTPSDASIARIDVDLVEKIVTINGSASSLETVNVFTDTLKFTNFTTESSKDDEQRAFSEVVLSNFSRDQESATYTITAKFDPLIFSGLENVTLTVPNIVTTRSEVAQPSALFQQNETGTEQ